jgi:hypothetical protein
MVSDKIFDYGQPVYGFPFSADTFSSEVGKTKFQTLYQAKFRQRRFEDHSAF